MKKALIIAALAAAAAAAAGVSWLVYSRLSRAVYPEGSFLGPVSAKVAIARDRYGVPMVRAENLDDAFVALGFLHAQDRYAVMEQFRAMALGSSSAVIQRDGEVIDRLSIGMGFDRRAREMAARLRQPFANYLEAYARGVNAARARFTLKDIVPKEWTASDCIAILLLREWASSFLDNREFLIALPRGEMSGVLGRIVPQEFVCSYQEGEEDTVAALKRLRAVINRHLGVFCRGYALFLPEHRITDQYPITAFSLEDTMPVFPGWYPVHLHAGDIIIKGISHTGLPFVFEGTNLYISFYAFSAGFDVQDFVAETVSKAGGRYQYLSSTGWSNFNEITIKGGAKGSMIVRVSERGPLVSDIVGGGNKGGTFAVIRSFFPGERYIESLFSVPLAKSIEEAAAWASGFAAWPRICLFASEDRAIRLWSGMVPMRKQREARIIVPSAESEWHGLYDLSMHRVAAAKDLTAGSFTREGVPQWAMPGVKAGDAERNRRLAYLLAKKKVFSIGEARTILSDTFSSTAFRFMPVFLSILEDNPVASARLTRIYFQNWKWRMKNDFVAPAVFSVLLKQFMVETYADELKELAEPVMEHWQLLAPSFLDIAIDGKSQLFDDSTTFKKEFRDAIFDRAFLKTMRYFNRSRGPDMNDWNWGALHQAHFTIPGPDTIFEKEVRDVPWPGGFDTLLSGGMGPDLRPTEVTSLTGLFSVERSLISMNFAYSTDPSSAFYGDGTGRHGDADFHEVRPAYVIEILPKR